MNQTNDRPYAPAERDALEARFALRVAAQLTTQASELPQDMSVRLRFAREQALARALAVRSAQLAQPTSVVGTGFGLSLARGAGGSGWWVQVASLLPLIALVVGLMLIQHWHDQSQIAAAAEVDASLLSDDLPPAAYSDPGFVEFLKTPRD